ncbi:MAG: RNA polymerase sigma factor RpoD/SigA [Treponemataceae bacterium]|nr:RNA polymerase sigma factor RpoD/SigA [Treponemataceae bacterium]
MEHSAYKSYVNQISRYPLLSFEQEIELSKRVQQGDSAAKMKLVQTNLRLVVSIAQKYKNSGISIMDLIQEGNIGLLSAASKYHYSFNTRFSTYAYAWIAQAIVRYIHNKCGIIAIPHRKEELLRKIYRTRILLCQENGYEPSMEEIAEKMNLSVEEIRQTEVYSFASVSIESEISNDSDKTVAEFVQDTRPTPEMKLMKEVESDNVEELLDTLPETEKIVIKNRYNFSYDLKVKTLRQLGTELGVSSETVRQMEKRAVRKLKVSASKLGITYSA